MYKEIMRYCSERMLFAEKIIPSLLASAGSHLLQLQNNQNPFFYANGRVERVNLSAIMIAPPGCSKSLSMSLLLGNQGLLPIENSFISVITEAGLIGSVDEEGNERYGLAYSLREGILVLDEMSTLLAPLQKDENVSLLNAVLELLSEGRIGKKLARAHIEYRSNMSLWGGVQVSSRRYDFTGGLPRRVVFIFIPFTRKMLKDIVKSRRLFKHQNEGYRELRNKVINYIKNHQIKEIDIDERTLKWMERHSLTGAERIKYEKLAFGFEYWNNGTESKTLKIKWNKELHKFLSQNYQMWIDVVTSPEQVTLKALVGKKGIKIVDLKRILGSFGDTEIQTVGLMMRYRDYLTFRGDKVLWNGS